MTGPLMFLGEPAIASTSSRRRHATLAALAVAIAACWHPGAHAQLSGKVDVYGSANVSARLGNSILVTTTNGADGKHSVIDWNAFSVPRNSFTHFQQPTADSTSINRVTGGKRSEIMGSLSSNGHLVLVNPSGIAFGENSSVDTAGFTASTLGMTDEDAIAGRLRFSAGKQTGALTVDGKARILARNGDVVLLGTDISIARPGKVDKPRKDDKDDRKDDRDKKDDKDDKGGKNDRPGPDDQADGEAQVWAPNGSIIIAAGQRVQLTGRGLEGIVLELTSSKDKLVNLGRLEGDAVGLFASQLEHSGIVKAQKVVLQDAKVRLERGGKDDDKGGKGGKDDDKGGKDDQGGKDDKGGSGSGSNSGSGDGNSGSGNSGNGTSNSGSGNSDSGSSGSNSGSGNSGSGNSGSGSSGSGSADAGSGNSGSANSGSGSGNSGSDTLPLGGGTIVIAPPPTPPVTTGGTQTPSVPVVVAPAPVVQPVLVTALAAPAAVTTELSASVINDYQAPAVTPAQSLDVNRQQDRFAAVRETPKEGREAAQCVR